MHRPKTERQALAYRLLGTADEPGPVDVGWLKTRYGIKGSGISRWREHGIPAHRVDDLETAIAQLTNTTKNAAPDIPERLESVTVRLEDAAKRLGPQSVEEALAVVETMRARMQDQGETLRQVERTHDPSGDGADEAQRNPERRPRRRRTPPSGNAQ